MCYRIFIRQQARCAVQAFSRKERALLTEKILLLGKNPFNERLRVQRLPGSACFRLRTGVFRIVFMTGDSLVKIVSVEKLAIPGGSNDTTGD